MQDFLAGPYINHIKVSLFATYVAISEKPLGPDYCVANWGEDALGVSPL
jgi:hypothetical protein